MNINQVAIPNGHIPIIAYLPVEQAKQMTQEPLGLMDLGIKTQVGAYDVFCRMPTPGCKPYTNKPMSYQASMLVSEWSRFGHGLEALIKSHEMHSSIDSDLGQLATDLSGKYRVISAIMRNAGDQIRWAPILGHVADQFDIIGRQLGPERIHADGLGIQFEKLGDLFAQFVDQHKVEFAYASVQTKFKVWKADIDATFKAINDTLAALKKPLADPNFDHLAGVLHEDLVTHMKQALASPVLLMNLDNDRDHHKRHHPRHHKEKDLMIMLI
jgi:hypothetical protein